MQTKQTMGSLESKERDFLYRGKGKVRGAALKDSSLEQSKDLELWWLLIGWVDEASYWLDCCWAGERICLLSGLCKLWRWVVHAWEPSLHCFPAPFRISFLYSFSQKLLLGEHPADYIFSFKTPQHKLYFLLSDGESKCLSITELLTPVK